MCRCKPDVWAEGPDKLLSQRFSDPQALLDSLATYYPKQYNEMNLDQAQLIGTGADAYAYCVNGRVVKFTQNREHAKVSWKLAKERDRYGYLVKTSNVAHLPDLGLWCISEERLNSLSDARKTKLYDYFDFGEDNSHIEFFIRGIISDLDRLGVKEWSADCVAAHNLLAHPADGSLIAFDFGHTHTHFPEDYPVWS